MEVLCEQQKDDVDGAIHGETRSCVLTPLPARMPALGPDVLRRAVRFGVRHRLLRSVGSGGVSCEYVAHVARKLLGKADRYTDQAGVQSQSKPLRHPSRQCGCVLGAGACTASLCSGTLKIRPVRCLTGTAEICVCVCVCVSRLCVHSLLYFLCM